MDVRNLFEFELRQRGGDICLDQRWLRHSNDFSAAVSGTAAPPLAPGQIIRVYNHRILIIGTMLGNMVVYQKNDDPSAMISYTCSKALDHLLQFPEMFLTYNEFIRVFHVTENVGIWVENVKIALLGATLAY